jgi:FAD/FMN-containing dehydrogenase
VGVNSAGHGAVAPIDEGVMISTQRLKKLEIDPEQRTARVGAGVKWHEVLSAAAPHGLAGLSGSSSDVGVIGYTVGGGMPIMGRKFGFAADRVKSLQLVTPDARVVHVDEEKEPELFWALCGGSGNFGG